MSEKYANADNHSATEYGIEFRAYSDDAWYSVRVFLEGEVLRVKYQGFSDDQDDVFNAKSFKSLEELKDFKERFRPESVQLQDNECQKIVEGMGVCACQFFSHDDVRFYDAIVEVVESNEHSFAKGEEECLCTFILHWLHGPNAGNPTVSNVGNICIVRPSLELDPIVATFLKVARERVGIASSVSNSIFKGGVVVASCDKNSTIKRKMQFSERIRKETRCAKQSASKISPTPSKAIVKCDGRTLEDLGGREKHCIILIGNLDKTLSSPTIVEFLHSHTEVLPKVYVYPSLSVEIFTRGAILLNCEKDFEKLCGFLNNPNHIIVSSTGRPWVIIEKLVGLKSIEAPIWTLMPITENIFQRGSSGKTDNLEVVYSGTPEFTVANKLKNLFLEFFAHQERLHKRLAFEEGKICYM